MIIREALDSELEDVLAIERAAFKQNEEVELVQKLLQDPSAKPLLSLIAFKDQKPVGHILFTKVELDSDSHCSASILCPMGVIPEFQKQGIGGELIKQGLSILLSRGVELVFVLGHPSYYPQYGFEPAGKHGLNAPYPIEEKNAGAWMVQELQVNATQKYRGEVICADTLCEPQYWKE